MDQIRELALKIAQSLADEPGSVTIDVIQGAGTTLLELRAARKDVGKIIGRQGQTVEAFRWILNAAASRSGRRCSLEVLQ